MIYAVRLDIFDVSVSGCSAIYISERMQKKGLKV